MEHLNYCRQLTAACSAFIKHPSADANMKRLFSHAIDLASASQKFILPLGGNIMSDAEFRGLDGLATLDLPYPFVALEFALSASSRWSRAIAFASQRDEEIAVRLAATHRADNTWAVFDEAHIPRTGFLENEGGRVKYRWSYGDEVPPDLEADVGQAPVQVVLQFLNALACSNVRIERSEPKKSGKKTKAALPFDTYHVLTIDAPGKAGEGLSTGGHRSPREHLRRGHIRRIADGRRIWVNATVVAAGRGAGVVTKAYALRGN